MKKISKNILMVVMMGFLALSGAACSRVDSGNVGVKVYLLGGDKGVDSEELGPGKYWIGWNEDLFIFPTFTQNYVWTQDASEGSKNDESLTFQTKNGLVVGADVGISYHIDPTKVNTIFQKYRRGIDEITDTFLRNMVRDAFVKLASKQEIEYIYGKGKEELVNDVQTLVVSSVKDIGIEIEQIYLIGAMRLPPLVTAAIDAKLVSTQKAQQRENEVAQSTAEANKKIEDARGIAISITTVADAQAKANVKLAKSLTPELIEYERVKKWDGVRSKIVGGATPLVSVGEM